jgi:hypothetical protein
MKLYGNAALSFRQCEWMVRCVVDEGWSVRGAALAVEVSAWAAGKWVAPAPDQREGRAVHPHHARRLGLRSDLPHQR